MPITPTYPGVYVEELPSGIRTITGVATSILAVVGYFTRGPVDSPVQLFNIGDFNRAFGGLNSNSEASYAIQQFFLNGGTEAWAVRASIAGVPSFASCCPDRLTVHAGVHLKVNRTLCWFCSSS